MIERFQVINKNTSISILKGCPVIIEAYSLLKDTKTDTTIAQLKMRNLSEKRVIAVKVSIEAFEINGTKVTGIDAFSFLDIRIVQGESFGDRKPITLPNNTTRIIKPCIIEVVFEDNTVWEHEAAEWELLKTADPFPFKEKELQKQYSIETKSECKNYPMVGQGFFVCSCGNINIEGNSCFRCGAALEDLITPLLDLDALKERAEARVVAEEYDICCSEQERVLSAEELRSLQKRFEKLGDYKDSAKRKVECEEKADQLEEEARLLEEKRQKEIQRKIIEENERAAKRKKRRPFIIIFSILSVVGIIIAGTYLNKVNKYNKANDLMDSKKYEEAIAEFEALGSFSNSEEKVLECTYQNAIELMNEKKYEAAILLFEQITTYKDSKTLAQTCQTKVDEITLAKNQQIYDEGKRYLLQKDYEKAISSFSSIKGFLDSDELLSEAKTALKEKGETESRIEQTTALYYEYLNAGDIYNAYLVLEGSKDNISGKSQAMTFLKKFVKFHGTWIYESGDATLLTKNQDESWETLTLSVKHNEPNPDSSRDPEDVYYYVFEITNHPFGQYWHYSEEGGGRFCQNDYNYCDWYAYINAKGNLEIVRTEVNSDTVVSRCEYKKQ